MRILNRCTGAVIYMNADIANLRELVETAVRRGADLSGADLIDADFNGLNLRRAHLYNTDLFGANFRGADLRGANLIAADLRGADLSGADLRGANLLGADFREADLSGADLRGANLDDANLPHPIYQFYLGKHHAVVQPTELRIGCEVRSWEHWLSNYEEIGRCDGLSEADIERHKIMIEAMYKIIKLGD